MKKHSQPRGIAVILVLLALAVLAVISAALVVTSSAGLQQANVNTEGSRALYAAEAGLNWKLAQLKAKNDGNVAMDLGTEVGRFEVQVFSTGKSPRPGFTVPSSCFYILSTGWSPDGLRRQVGMLVKRSESAFNLAVLANKKIQMDADCYTDTYDSSGGVPDHTLATLGLYNPEGQIQLQGGYVGKKKNKGLANIYAPVGADKNLVMSDGKSVEGVHYASFVTTPLIEKPKNVNKRLTGKTDIKTGKGTTILKPVFDKNKKEWVFQGNQVIVEAGGIMILDISGVPDDAVAHFDFDSLQMMTGGSIVLEAGASKATADFYVTGDFKISGGSIVNPQEIPARFQFNLFQQGLVEISLDSAAYFIVNAPGGFIKLTDGSELFGSVIAREVLLEKASVIHYDQALREAVTPGVSSLQQLSYQQL